MITSLALAIEAAEAICTSVRMAELGRDRLRPPDLGHWLGCVGERGPRNKTGVTVAEFLFQRCCCHSVLVEHVPTTAAGYSIGCYRHKLRRGTCTYPRSGRQ